MSSDLGKPSELLMGACNAVVAATEYVDRYRGPEQPVARAGMDLVHVVTRVGVSLNLALSIDETKRVFFRRRTGRRTLTHAVRFQLVAQPDPPRPISRVIVGQREPGFFVSPEQEREVRDQLTSLLRESNSARYFVGDPPKQASVHEEADRVADRENELVVFNLQSKPASFLVVRVTPGKKGKKDGLFRLTPKVEKPLEIYTFPRDGQRSVEYGPLHALTLALRDWRASPVWTRSPPAAGRGLGFESLDDFARQFLEGAESAVNLLARTEPTDRALPSFYGLEETEAVLSFSMKSGDEEDSVQFDELSDDEPVSVDDGEQRVSQVVLRVQQQSSALHMDIELSQLEFLLSGRPLVRLIRQIMEARGVIAARLSRGSSLPASHYVRLIENAALQGRVVALRTTGQELAEELLVTWPSGLSRESRDVVFTLKRRGEQITGVRKVMDLSDDMNLVLIGTGVDETGEEDDDLARREYAVFHRFFRSIALWRRRA